MSGKNLLEQAVAQCRKSAAEEWEVFSIESRRLSVEAREGEVDAFEVSDGAGVSVRVRVGGRTGFSYSAEGSPDALKAMVESAISGARSSDPDPDETFSQPSDIPQLDLWDEDMSNVSQEEKIESALKLEAKVRDYDKRIKTVRQASYGEGSRIVRLINSNGVELEAKANGCSASVMAVAGDNGQSQMGWDYSYSPTWSGLDVEAIGINAARDAVEMLGAKTIPTREAPVVLRNTAAAELLSVLGSSFLGEFVEKGKSMLASKRGQKIFSELIDIYDDGLLKSGPSSFPFDAEGSPRQTTALVKKGNLEAFLYDLKWGKRSGEKSTGNSNRGGYTSPPVMGITNLYIPAGKRSPGEIIKEMGDGLLVKDLMGVHTANAITGDFSLGAAGTWYEKGEPVHPVQSVTVAGNLLELFACVDAVADDLKFVDRIGAPSLKVTCLTISGE